MLCYFCVCVLFYFMKKKAAKAAEDDVLEKQEMRRRRRRMKGDHGTSDTDEESENEEPIGYTENPLLSKKGKRKSVSRDSGIEMMENPMMDMDNRMVDHEQQEEYNV